MPPPAPDMPPPRPVTVLRLKRPRSAPPLSALHVALPVHKRPHSLAPLFSSLSLSAPHIRFRRLAAARVRAALAVPGVTIVDVEPGAVRRGTKRRMEDEGAGDRAGEEREGQRKSARVERGMLCNGVPMQRVSVDDEDLYVREGQVLADAGGEHVVVEEALANDPSSEGEMAYVRAEDLPEFVFDDECSEEERDDEDDLDGESVDYPSTPESVSERDEWEQERRPFGIAPAVHDNFEYAHFASDEDGEYDGEGWGDEGEDS